MNDDLKDRNLKSRTTTNTKISKLNKTTGKNYAQ